MVGFGSGITFRIDKRKVHLTFTIEGVIDAVSLRAIGVGEAGTVGAVAFEAGDGRATQRAGMRPDGLGAGLGRDLAILIVDLTTEAAIEVGVGFWCCDSGSCPRHRCGR